MDLGIVIDAACAPSAGAPVGPGAPARESLPRIRLAIPRAPEARVRVELVGAYGVSVLASLSPDELGLRARRGDVARAVCGEIAHRIAMLQFALDALEGGQIALPLEVVDRRPVQGCALEREHAGQRRPAVAV